MTPRKEMHIACRRREEARLFVQMSRERNVYGMTADEIAELTADLRLAEDRLAQEDEKINVLVKRINN